MGTTGWEAYTIGFTLVGCIVAGAGLGWFLDNRFGTSFWLPILFLVGVVGGFREMMLTLNRISQNQTKTRKEQANRETANLYTPPSPDATDEPLQAPRERLFSVPPPPFENEGEPKPQETEPETTDEIIARLLNEADEDDEREKKRRA